MTFEEYQIKHDKYIKKANYYRRKAEKLEDEMFCQMNKDNKFLKRLCGKEQNDK